MSLGSNSLMQHQWHMGRRRDRLVEAEILGNIRVEAHFYYADLVFLKFG
jgi:hypothetical protein